MSKFAFDLGAKVALKSGETGEVVARAKYLYSKHHYLVRYTAGDGRMVESWWGESALSN